MIDEVKRRALPVAAAGCAAATGAIAGAGRVAADDG